MGDPHLDRSAPGAKWSTGAFCTSCNARNRYERSLEWHEGRSIHRSRSRACFAFVNLQPQAGPSGDGRQATQALDSRRICTNVAGKSQRRSAATKSDTCAGGPQVDCLLVCARNVPSIAPCPTCASRHDGRWRDSKTLAAPGSGYQRVFYWAATASGTSSEPVRPLPKSWAAMRR
jgi:hypothetical protein